ncbi:hypothetical protein F2Q69_00050854 [Brassica cretica]|uniref:Uncharacterized protein n=1 Tax=Brassica cretica TaxID=69181 RepID=A0A8S9PU68_BRACR|nr:hypothetical protein F2Q69_00050854 [Brassica cretica]
MEGSSKRLRKGAWIAEEDNLLRQCIDKYGEGKWHQVPLRAGMFIFNKIRAVGLNRCRKSCRLRWLNYLKPSINRGKFNSGEVDLLLRLHKLLGNRLPGRTANDVKNYWNTHLSKEHEPGCKTQMKKRNLPCSSTTPAQKNDVFKPRPRSFTVNNGCSHISGMPEAEFVPLCLGFNDANNIGENSFTCNKDDNKSELVSNLVDGQNMWWESLLDESQDPAALCPEATATKKGATSAFDVEQLWSLLDGEART